MNVAVLLDSNVGPVRVNQLGVSVGVSGGVV